MQKDGFRHKSGFSISLFFFSILLCTLGLKVFVACSALPVKMECQQLETRLDYENLSSDQRRFAEAELEQCREKLGQAQARDSVILHDGVDSLRIP